MQWRRADAATEGANRRQIMRKWIALVLIAALAMTLLAGCSREQAESTTPAQEAGQAVEGAVNQAGETIDAAADQAGEAIDAAADQAGETIDKAVDEAKEAVDDATQEAKDATTGK
jgi:predicted RNase H-like HicB family nuclease